jgi:hypothetical protein
MPEESRVWVRFAQFVITVVIGLVVLATLRWKRKRRPSLGRAFHTVLFLGTAAFFSYQILSAHWTTSYNGRPVLIREVYTSLGRERSREANPRLSRGSRDALRGAVEKIWTRITAATPPDPRRHLRASDASFHDLYYEHRPALQCAVAKTKSRKRAPSAAVRASHAVPVFFG